MWRRRQREQSDNDQVVNPLLEAWARQVDVSGVSDQVASDIERFMRSRPRMLWSERRELAFRLVSVVSAQVSPPPSEFINPLDVLATVLTLREQMMGPASPGRPERPRPGG